MRLSRIYSVRVLLSEFILSEVRRILAWSVKFFLVRTTDLSSERPPELQLFFCNLLEKSITWRALPKVWSNDLQERRLPSYGLWKVSIRILLELPWSILWIPALSPAVLSLPLLRSQGSSMSNVHLFEFPNSLHLRVPFLLLLLDGLLGGSSSLGRYPSFHLLYRSGFPSSVT